MYRYQLYNTEDVEELKKKLKIYKQTLNTIKSGDTVEDYLNMKVENSIWKEKISVLEGAMIRMEENYKMESDRYNNQIDDMLIQMQALNDSVTQLTNDVSLIKERVVQFDVRELKDRVNHVIDLHEKNQEAKEIEFLKNEILQLKKQLDDSKSEQETVKTNKTKKSEYRQLQNMLKSSRQITPIESEKKTALTHKPRSSISTKNTDSKPSSLKRHTNHATRSIQSSNRPLTPYDLNKTFFHSDNNASIQRKKNTKSKAQRTGKSLTNSKKTKVEDAESEEKSTLHTNQEKKTVADTKPDINKNSASPQTQKEADTFRDQQGSNEKQVKPLKPEGITSNNTTKNKLEFSTIFSLFQKKN